MRRTLASIALALAPATVAAQAVTKDAPARTAEQAAVLAVVGRLFDAMRAGDSAAVRAVFHPDARLGSVGMREGAPVLRMEGSVAEFAKAVGTPHAEVWDERTANETVHVDGALAVAWTPYVFRLGDRVSHCGVNVFQLFRGADGWKIFSLFDTRRREGCE